MTDEQGVLYATLLTLLTGTEPRELSLHHVMNNGLTRRRRRVWYTREEGGRGCSIQGGGRREAIYTRKEYLYTHPVTYHSIHT